MITKQKTVAKRLWTLVTLFIVNLLVYGWIEHWNAQQLSHQIHTIGETQLPASRNMTLTDMMHDGIRAVIYRALFEASVANEQAFAEIKSEYAEFSSNIGRYSDAIESLNVSDSTKQAIAKSRPALAAYIASGQAIVDAATNRNLAAAKALLPAFDSSFKDLEIKLGELGDLIEKDSTAALNHAIEVEERSNIITLVVMLAGILVALFNGFLSIRSLTNELNAVTGELTTQAAQMHDSSLQINSAAQSLSESSTQQSSAIEETVTSMEEITSMIGQTAQNTNETQEQTNKAQEIARTGKNVVDRMVASMTEISSANDKLNTIVKVIDEIQSKTKIINDIAFETRLLSFNASIEAARAGAHGRGFAVVAEEVGKLASVSSKAADDVRDLLESSLNQVSSIVDETKMKVSEGQNRSKECEQAFSNVEHVLERMGQSVQLIATATREQQGGVKQTNQAMSEMEKVTQVNARSAENLTTEARRVTSNAEQVSNSIRRLQTLVGTHTLGSDKSQAETKTPQKPAERKKTPRNHAKSDRQQNKATEQIPVGNDGKIGKVSLVATARAEAKPQQTAPAKTETVSDTAEPEVSRDDNRWFAA